MARFYVVWGRKRGYFPINEAEYAARMKSIGGRRGRSGDWRTAHDFFDDDDPAVAENLARSRCRELNRSKRKAITELSDDVLTQQPKIRQHTITCLRCGVRATVAVPYRLCEVCRQHSSEIDATEYGVVHKEGVR